jgi:FAD/FMN-containing dehydrogenase
MSDTSARTGKILGEPILNEFKAGLRGELIRPGDVGYDEARKVYNAMIDKRPGLIVRCVGVADVIGAVNFARAHNLLVAVRGAGHNVAGNSVCDDGMVIDLSRMKGIWVDTDARTVRVEAGLTWGEVNHELQVFGLAATGGFVSTTGVSGLTLGGGLGWLVRKHGLALDSLLSVDVVTADGRVLKANSSQHQDLFWGMRGGGGNFGIATSFEFKVHPVSTVLGGLVLHPLSKGKEALRFWRDYEATAPEELTAGALVFNASPGLPLPELLRKEPIVAMGGVYAGALEAGEHALRRLREFGPPAADIFQPMPYEAAQTMADFLWPNGFYNYWKSSFLTGLVDGAIDIILDFFARAPSPRTVVVIEHNGDGAMNRVAAEDTAFGHRNWPYNFLVTSIWTDPAHSEANIQWTRDFYHAMQPFLADAAYVNYLGEEGEERIRSAYTPAKYERLCALKKKYDPTNLFRLNQNFKPNT